MKLIDTSTLESDNLDGAVQYSMKATGKAFCLLMDKLYSNKLGSVIREVCSNAFDSHKTAGKAEVPFKVILPNTLEADLVVQDFGTGLSKEDCFRLFGTLFESTKESSNSDIGAFGLGSKSPYAITEQFTVTSRFNGMEYLFLAFRGKGGTPNFMLTNEQETTEPNGIIFTIPIDKSDIYKVPGELKRQLAFFPTKPLVKNSGSDETFWKAPTQVTDLDARTQIIHGCAVSGIRVKMGPVSYPLDLNQLDDTINRKLNLMHNQLENSVCLVTEFPMGDLDLPPNRESLSYDNDTKNALNTYYGNLVSNYEKNLFAELELKTTLFDAVEWFETNKDKHRYLRAESVDVIWDGKDIKKMFTANKFVSFERVEQTEDRLVSETDITTGIVTTTTVQHTGHHDPFYSNSVKTYPNVQNSGKVSALNQLDYRTVRLFVNGDLVIFYNDDAKKLRAKLQYWLDQWYEARNQNPNIPHKNTPTIMVVTPNEYVIDRLAVSKETFVDTIAELTGRSALLRGAVINTSSLLLPPPKPKAPPKPRAAVTGELKTVKYNQDSGRMSSGKRIENASELVAGRPFVELTRGSMASGTEQRYILRMIGCGIIEGITTVSKSAVREVAKMKEAGMVPWKEWFSEKAEDVAGDYIMKELLATLIKDIPSFELPKWVPRTQKIASIIDTHKKIAQKLMGYDEKVLSLDPARRLYDHYSYNTLSYEVASNKVNVNIFQLRRNPDFINNLKEVKQMRVAARLLNNDPVVMLLNKFANDFSRFTPAQETSVVNYINNNF